MQVITLKFLIISNFIFCSISLSLYISALFELFLFIIISPIFIILNTGGSIIFLQ